jgi:hypothetical protein
MIECGCTTAVTACTGCAINSAAIVAVAKTAIPMPLATSQLLKKVNTPASNMNGEHISTFNSKCVE